MAVTVEHARLAEASRMGAPWRKWGPYLSERQWGTVREDYSDNGDPWSYFPHDQARSRAYHWGEDGIAGISDDQQRLCFALALWNGRDPILKERMFGLTNAEGNHGEDVKEYYFYLDSTPTHSYMKYLYKYPQAAYPYDQLIAANRGRGRSELEFELLDTGVFEGDRYFDVFVEYAKAAPEDLLVEVMVVNRGPEAAPIHILPSLWFRNTWSWSGAAPGAVLKSADAAAKSEKLITAELDGLGRYELHCEGEPTLLFTNNETNNRRLFGGENLTPYVKDAFHEYLVHQHRDAVSPEPTGTKSAAHYRLEIPGGGSASIRLRLRAAVEGGRQSAFREEFGITLAARRREADEFYEAITPESVSEDQARVLRQALAGMLWSKQYYVFDAARWLAEHDARPRSGGTRPVRNREWYHMVNEDVISMPDKWEYPWYATWDLAFHCIALSAVDPAFAREQMMLMLREVYMHPSGQIPAYEWNYGDVNPPVHAWATLFMHRFSPTFGAEDDTEFLKRTFMKLALNFNWWANRKDRFGQSVFEGGFIGLDSVGVFDRNAPLPTGGFLEQADGTAWAALYCQNMVELAIELAAEDPSFEDMVLRFGEHFFWIASGMNHTGPNGMWDEEDGFYYDVLRKPDGTTSRLRVRSLVGLLPLCATTVTEQWQCDRVKRVGEYFASRLKRMPELLDSVHVTGPEHRGVAGREILALVNEQRLRRILTRMLDEEEFLSPYGVRALSRHHLDDPYVFRVGADEYRVWYLPAESNTGMFGGNSNWRGPIWLPVNVLLVRALLQYYLYYGDDFRIECPTGSGQLMNLFEVSMEICRRLESIFVRGPDGRRAVYGGTEKFQTDPHWRDLILFYEYFHGDNGAGLGAGHQTGWTGLIARLIQIRGCLDAKSLLEGGVRGLQRRMEPKPQAA